MANIGSFKKVGRDYQGEIVTLSVQAKGVRIVAETNRSNDAAPTHRVFVGSAEIGAAWTKTSAEQRDYLSVKLDDPSFTAPIFANLWTERHYQDGSLARTERWSAILTVNVQPPRDPDALRKNPLGLFVNAINWSKELSQ